MQTQQPVSLMVAAQVQLEDCTYTHVDSSPSLLTNDTRSHTIRWHYISREYTESSVEVWSLWCSEGHEKVITGQKIQGLGINVDWKWGTISQPTLTL